MRVGSLSSWCRGTGRVGLVVVLFSAWTAIAAPAAAQEQRTWTDSTGRFKIEAKFLSQAGGKVTLERPDGSQFEIDLTKLSDADQQYVKQLQTDNPFKRVDDNPFQPKMTAPSAPAPAAAPPTSGRLPVSQPQRVAVNWSSARLVNPAPLNQKWEFNVDPAAAPAPSGRQRAVPVPSKRDFWEGTKGFVANDRCNWGVIGYLWEKQNEVRLVLCDLEKGRTAQGTAQGKMVPLALSDNGSQVLMRREEFGFGNQDRLELWTLTASGISKGIEWIPYEDAKGGGRDVKWAHFLDDTRLATVSGEGKLAVWDYTSARPIYHLNIKGGSVPALSPDRKYLAFVGKKQIGVLDVDAGEVVSVQPAPDMAWPRLAFSPSGARLACIAHGGKLYVWNFADGEMYRETTLKDVHGNELVFPSERHVLVGKKILFDLDNQVNLWKYDGHEFVDMVDGVCWFAVTGAHNRPGAVVPSPLPHPGVEDALKEAMADPEFFVLKPGVTVRLIVDALADPAGREKARAALTQKLEERGFKVGQNGTIDLVALTEVGDEREVSYHTFGHFGSRTYKVREHFSILKFVYQGKTAWEVRAGNVPHFISLKEGETVEDVLRRSEKPNYDYFTRVELPKLLTKPTGSPTLGSSQVTVSGLQ